MAGRKPTPTKLRMLRGNPGRRPLNEREPKPRADRMPPCPKHLDRIARSEWRRTGRELRKLGLLTVVDRAAFAAYCQSYSTWIQAQEAIAKHGMLVKAPSGYPMVSPYVSIANQALKQMRAFLAEFGMTPSARSRVQVADPEEPDPFAEYLSRRGRRGA